MTDKVKAGEIYQTSSEHASDYLLVIKSGDSGKGGLGNVVLRHYSKAQCDEGGITGSDLRVWLSNCEKLPFTINDLLEAGLEAMKEEE